MRDSRRLLSILIVAACLSTGTATRATEHDPVVATINGHQVRAADIQAEIGAMPLGDQIVVRQQAEQFKESVIREEILFQYLLATDFAGAPALRQRVRQLAVEELLRREVTDHLLVSDTEVRAFFDTHPGAMRGEYAQMSQVLLPSRSQCEALQTTIATSEEFAAAAREHSLHEPSAKVGGDLGLIMNHSGPLGFEEALFDLQPGQMAVYDSSEGCHLVRMGKRVTPPLPPFDNVAPAVRGFLARRRERELLSALLERALDHVKIER